MKIIINLHLDYILITFPLPFEQNKEENAHRFALSAIRGEPFERERDSFGILYTGHLLVVRELEKKRESEREREIRYQIAY